MLRLAYLSLLYWRCGGNVWALLKGKQEKPEVPGGSTVLGDGVEDGSGGMAPASQVPPMGSGLGSARVGGDAPRDPALVNSLKRSIIREKITPLMMLTSVVADLDLFADWLFLEEGLEDQSQLLSDVALAFTVIGTFMHVLVTLEFHPVSVMRAFLRGRPLSPGQHISLGRQLLLNVIVEDIPQLIITGIADPSSVAGVLNIATAGFSLLAKAAEAFATLRDPPMSAQARKIEADPGVVRYMNRQKLKAERLVASTAMLVSKYREEVDRGAGPRRLVEIAFEIMQADGGFMDGELDYVRHNLNVPLLELKNRGQKGPIPPQIGSLSRLTELDLSDNQLKGAIPTEFGNLNALTTLDLSKNKLNGTIPRQLGVLRDLRAIRLGFNQLTGAIPIELGNLSRLERLSLHTNKLDGTIPPELGGLKALQELYLFRNQLTGMIPLELGGLTTLQTLHLGHNELSGAIPPELGRLTALKKLYLTDNKLTGAIPPELGGLTTMQKLGLRDNQLTGSIPDELGQLKALNFAWLYGNKFDGLEEEVKRLLPDSCTVYW